MRKKKKYLPELVLILVLFALAASSNALSRMDTKSMVEGEVYAAEQRSNDVSLAEIRRMLLGSTK